MSKRGAKLGSSTVGEIPKFKPDEPQWTELSSTLRADLTSKAKSELVKICNKFLEEHAFEISTELVSSKIEYADRFIRHTKGLSELADKFANPSSDVEAQLAADLEHFLQLSSIEIEPTSIRQSGTRDGDPAVIRDPGESMKVEIAVNPGLLSEMAFRLEHAARAVRKQTEIDKYELFEISQDGVPFHKWMLAVRDWAMKHEYPYGAFSNDDGAPAPFSKFLFNLSGLFSSQYALRVNSAAAMAGRLKRAQKKHQSSKNNNGYK